MKKKIIVHDRFGPKEKEVTYIPIRFIFAILLIILETAAVWESSFGYVIMFHIFI